VAEADARMPRVKVLELAALPPGQAVLVTVGREDVALFRQGDEVFAIGNECAHQGGSLSDGLVEGDIVTCPRHGWEVDVRSGACMTVPGEAVPRYAVMVEAGAIFLEEAS
jgi:nitrite reductase/ring-hydroxylating ferredoxin subunit